MGGIKDICMIFLFIWIGLTLFLGSMVVGINVILNLTSSLRLLIGVALICFSVTMFILSMMQDVLMGDGNEEEEE